MIFRLSLFAGLFIILLLSGRAQNSTPARTDADAEITAISALAEAQPPGDPKTMGTGQYIRALDGNRQRLTAAVLAFYEGHPADPRRWGLVVKAAALPPFFAQSFGPDVETKGLQDAVIDEAARTAWQAKIAGLKAALLAASDAPPGVRESVEWENFGRDFRAATLAKRQDKPYDFKPFKARFDAHVAKYAQLDILANRAADYLGALEGNLPGSTGMIWRQLFTAPNPALRAKAEERVKFLDLISQPLDIAFTAADGRAVDLKNLRGKVVLVDFWATWCGPCKEELPNVVANYRKYHDQGFEVVGIALENGKLLPTDTPEQTAAKLEAAKKILTDFTAGNGMPWPQYFDGKYWKNDISTKYAINAVPAMFLLDQEGRVVSTNARGEKLEAEVKRLLKL